MVGRTVKGLSGPYERTLGFLRYVRVPPLQKSHRCGRECGREWTAQSPYNVSPPNVIGGGVFGQEAGCD